MIMSAARPSIKLQIASGIATTDNNRFLRMWYDCLDRFNLNSDQAAASG